MKKPKTTVTKQYKLKRDVAPLCFMLNSHHNKRSPLLYFDEESGVNKPLRYARNQKSPFEEEQDGNAIMEPIVFEDGFLTVDRTNLWQAQTPQMYRFGLLLKALNSAHNEGAHITDEASAIERMGLSSLLVESSKTNLKITNPEDLSLANFYLKQASTL